VQSFPGRNKIIVRYILIHVIFATRIGSLASLFFVNFVFKFKPLIQRIKWAKNPNKYGKS